MSLGIFQFRRCNSILDVEYWIIGRSTIHDETSTTRLISEDQILFNFWPDLQAKIGFSGFLVSRLRWFFFIIALYRFVIGKARKKPVIFLRNENENIQWKLRCAVGSRVCGMKQHVVVRNRGVSFGKGTFISAMLYLGLE